MILLGEQGILRRISNYNTQTGITTNKEIKKMEFTISLGMDSEIAVPAIIAIASIVVAWIFARSIKNENIGNHSKDKTGNTN